MQLGFLDLVRCPYCGGRVGFVESAFHRRTGDELHDGILGCYCCAFPVVAGIPVLHLEPVAATARRHVDRGEPEEALIALFEIDDEERAAAFKRAIASQASTYRDLVEILGPNFEGGYFLYRFSDPTYVVAQSIVRAIAAVVIQDRGSERAAPPPRAIDVCGGSGHLTRTLAEHTPEPVLADLHFSKLWLAKRFTAPTCQPVCCDGNAPLPFAANAFRIAVCSDAFHYIWTKRLLASEMMRLVGGDGVVALTHVHNERRWSPSPGMPLPPEGYAGLFADLGARVYSERRLLEGIVGDQDVDLERLDAASALDVDPAVTVIATRRRDVFARHRAAVPSRGPLHLNPLYVVEPAGGGVLCRLRFPSADYADEYGDCRQYLPDEITIASGLLAAVRAGHVPAEAVELVRRRVLLELPDRYS